MDFTFDITQFIVGEYTAYSENYNTYFKEYLITAEHADEIEEVKQSGIKVFELPDGLIHFNKVAYENIIKQTVE